MEPDTLDVRDSRFMDQAMTAAHLEGCGEPTVLDGCTISGALIGIRADSCAARFQGNTIIGARECGIRLYDDRGSIVKSNEIAVDDDTPRSVPRGIYCSNAFDSVEVSVVDNQVKMMVEDVYAEGVCLYALPQASVDLSGNEITGPGTHDDYTKGVRLVDCAPVVRWNRLSDCYYYFYVECAAGQIPDLGDTSGYGNNATNDAAPCNIYATAQAPVDSLSAQMNWWGTTNPSGRKFWGVNLGIRWNPHLESDPGGRGFREDTDQAVFAWRLDQNAPNPFNPVTVLSYAVPEECRVRIAVYDLRGRLVRVIVDDVRPRGEHGAVWDGKNDTGQRVGSGVYFMRMEAASFRKTRKIVLLK
jgi:hypothetical protein